MIFTTAVVTAALFYPTYYLFFLILHYTWNNIPFKRVDYYYYSYTVLPKYAVALQTINR